jgi:hypothetical protein
VSGVSAEYLDARSWTFVAEDNFSDADVRNAMKVCLIGGDYGEVIVWVKTWTRWADYPHQKRALHRCWLAGGERLRQLRAGSG